MTETNPLAFISYRSGDQALAALLLDRDLSHRYGPDRVFLDSRSLVAGTAFEARLLGALRGCAVLIAVIGRDWLTLTDDHGRRLIDRRRDYVRREIAEGLTRGVPVVPVLVEDAHPLVPASLPPSIRGLAKHQFVRLRSRSYRADLDHLLAQLDVLTSGNSPGGDVVDRHVVQI